MKKLALLLLLPLFIFAQDSAFEPGKAKSTGNKVNVRNIASTGGTVVTTVDRGTVFDVVERSKSESTIDGYSDYWYKVKTEDGKTGWIFGKFISFDLNLEGGLKWKSVNPASGQIFSGIVVSSNGTVYAGTEEGNIFISSEGGKSWKKIVPLALGIHIGRINKIAIHKSGMWISATGDSNGGVWKSQNNGASWTQFTVSQGLLSNDVYDVVDSGAEGIFVATSKGVCVSRDGGASWSNYPPKKEKKGVTCIAVAPDGSVVAGTKDGLYIATKANPKWVQIGEDGPNMGDKIQTVAITSTGDLYVGTDKGLAKSNVSRLEKWYAIGGKTQVNQIVTDAAGRILVSTDNGLNISIDNGASWITYKSENGIASNRVFQIATSPKDNTIWVSAKRNGLSFNE